MKSIISVLMAVSVTVAVLPVRADQKQRAENPAVVSLMNQFSNASFYCFGAGPRNTLARIAAEKDMQRIAAFGIDSIKEVVSKLDKLDAEHKFTEVFDSSGVYRAKYTINLHPCKTGQTEILTFNYNKASFKMKYLVQDDSASNSSYTDKVRTPQNITDKIDRQLRMYTGRKDAISHHVVFDKIYDYNEYCLKGNHAVEDLKTVGERYVLPNGSDSDYTFLENFLRSFTDVEYCTSQERGNLKMITIRLVDSRMCSILISVALKGNELHIIRVTGTEPWTCVLPRRWHEGIGDVDKKVSDTTESLTTDSVYELSQVDECPSFPGGKSEFDKYIKANRMNLVEGVEKHVTVGALVKCVVQKTGKLTNIHADSGFGDKINAEAERLARNMPRWVCATKNGQPVDCRFMFKIDFPL